LLPTPAGGGGAPEIVDASTINVKLVLNDISLHDALDAVMMVAERPIKYSVEDYAVVVSAKPSGPEPPILEMRVFKVDPNTFFMGLQNVSTIQFGSANSSSSSSGGTSGGSGGSSSGSSGNSGNSGGQGGQGGQGSSVSGAIVPVVLVTGESSGGQGGSQGGSQGGGNRGGGGGGGNRGGGTGGGGTGGGGGGGGTGAGGLSYINPSSTQAQDISAVAQNFFTAIGVNMAAVGRSVAFNDRLGLLFVKASPSELDTIERVIQSLNQVAPQVHIKTRFIEVGQDDSAALGFDWYLGNFVNGKVIANGGSAPSLYNGDPLTTGYFPGQTTANQIVGSGGDQLLTGGLRNSGPALATVTGILTDPNFRVVLHALQQRTGTETLAEPEAVTTSGRQAQMRATDIEFILTGFSFTSGQGGTVGTATTAATAAGTSAVTPNTQQFEIGPTLDVVPYVLSDGFTINLSLLPQVLQFLQYDPVPQVPGYTPNTAVVAGGTATLPTVLPHFTVRSIVTEVNIWDNQTIVLGGLISSSINSTKDKVPFLADVPLLGRLFQSQSKDTKKKNLMIFVTATIVDPAGNRVHSDDELPFNPVTIPVQPAVEGQTFLTNSAAGAVAPAGAK
jgi:type II secretory pathway component GspD/PulD (secretin)